MHKILIDTTSRYEKSVRLFADEKKLGERFGDIDVVSSIVELLQENDLKLSAIAEFGCNPGPGSFTGIKIGVTVTNILNFFANKKGLGELTKPCYGKEPNIR